MCSQVPQLAQNTRPFQLSDGQDLFSKINFLIDLEFFQATGGPMTTGLLAVNEYWIHSYLDPISTSQASGSTYNYPH